MRYFTGLAALLLISIPARSQQAPNEIQQYAPYNIALLPNSPLAEVVLPFITTDSKLAFFPASQVQQASKENRILGRLVSYGEVIALIGELQIEVNRLSQENERLWAVVTKTVPPQTIVVQTQPATVQPVQQNNDALMKYMLIRQLFPSPTPSRTINLNLRDCTRYPALCVH